MEQISSSRTFIWKKLLVYVVHFRKGKEETNHPKK